MLDRKLSVAPMMGCTDQHCRLLFRLLAPNTLLYSEMIVTGALLHGDAEHFLAHSDDEPAAVQLGGSHPEELAKCAAMIEQAGYQEVNLNAGCPSDRVQQGGIGACLMASPALVADCYVAMAESTGLPVTIKTRIGIDDHDDYEFFRDFIRPSHQAGCRTFIIHARKAILKGLSPKENREIPPLNYDFVTRIQSDFPDTTFVLNGGISDLAQAQTLLNTFDGVMLGRAPYNNPYLLAELDHVVYGSELRSRESIMLEYRAYILDKMHQGVALKHMAKHLFGLFTGIPGARAFRRHLSTHMNRPNATISVLDDALAELGSRQAIQEKSVETGSYSHLQVTNSQGAN